MEVKFTLVPNDLKSLYKFLARRTPSPVAWIYRTISIGVILFAIAASVIPWLTHPLHHAVDWKIFGGVLLEAFKLPVAVFCAVGTALYYARKKDMAENPLYTYSRTMRITPDGMRQSTNGTETVVQWATLADVADDTAAIYFVPSKNEAYCVPKRAFATPDEAERFLTTAHAYWNAARTGTPLPADISDDSVWPPAPRTL